MRTTYLVWKQPLCNGSAPEWQEITGQEFLALVRSADGAGRYFIKLPGHTEDGSDSAIVLETTRADYLEWKREKNRADYLRNLAKGFNTVSYHSLESEDGSYGEELLADTTIDVTAESIQAIDRQTLSVALASLSPEDYRLIAYLYLSDEKGTERGYSELTGIPQKTVNDRKNRILAKLKKFF